MCLLFFKKKKSTSVFDKGQSFMCAEPKATAGPGLELSQNVGLAVLKLAETQAPTTLSWSP